MSHNNLDIKSKNVLKAALQNLVELCCWFLDSFCKECQIWYEFKDQKKKEYWAILTILGTTQYGKHA
jgi:hypothetical protein